MFLTRNTFKSSSHERSLDRDEQLWDSVELFGHKQWVMLTIEHTQVNGDGDEVSFPRIVFLRNFMSFFSKKFKTTEGEKVRLVAAQIFWPPDDGSHEWSTDSVAKVWMAESDDDLDGPIEVCETKSGEKYILSELINYKIKLKNQKIIFEF